MLYALGPLRPTLSSRHYIAPSATVIGNVRIGQDVSIWFNVVIRGDNDRVVLGNGTNVQDGAVLHLDEGFPLSIGKRVTIGHKAMVHGCTIGNESLIGMNAVVLNGAIIGRGCLIGANALVTEGMEVPDGSLVLGSPGKIVKQIGEGARALMARGAQHYIDKIAVYRDSLVPLDG